MGRKEIRIFIAFLAVIGDSFIPGLLEFIHWQEQKQMSSIRTSFLPPGFNSA